MSVVFIFEDNCKSPVSRLLRKGFNGENIHFSSGAYNLLGKYIELRHNGSITDLDSVFIMIDYVPNNSVTLTKFDDLVEYFIDNDNVTVVPIPCIEYYVLLMLDKLGLLCTKSTYKYLEDCILRKFDWGSVSSTDKKKSLETLYKSILSDQDLNCLHNRLKEDGNSDLGLFYIHDCMCENKRKMCSVDYKRFSDLLYKAEVLLTMLPVFDVVSDDHREYLESIGVVVNSDLSVDSLLYKLDDFYKAIFNSMNIAFSGIV